MKIRKTVIKKIMKPKGKIVVIGSSNTDMVIYTSRFPGPGETILGGRFLMNAGGKGANQAVAAARTGGNVSFIGKVGNDLFGKQAVQNLRKEGIDVSPVIIDLENASGIAQILVDETGENMIVVAPGANMALGVEDLGTMDHYLKEAEILLMQMEIPLSAIEYAAKTGFRNGKKVILNPAPAMLLPEDLYPCLYMITPNAGEAELLTGVKVTDEHTAGKAAEILKAKGVKTVIITLGSKGAYLSADGVTGLIPVPEVKAVDTTAAGDTFNGALAVALTAGSDLESAVRFANKAASIAVTRPGAQSSVPYLKEIEGFDINSGYGIS